MFSGLVQEHQRRVAAERNNVEKHRGEATLLASKLSDTLVDSVNAGVAEVSQLASLAARPSVESMMPSRRASAKENVADADRSLDLSLSLCLRPFRPKKLWSRKRGLCKHKQPSSVNRHNSGWDV